MYINIVYISVFNIYIYKYLPFIHISHVIYTHICIAIKSQCIRLPSYTKLVWNHLSNESSTDLCSVRCASCVSSAYAPPPQVWSRKRFRSSWEHDTRGVPIRAVRIKLHAIMVIAIQPMRIFIICRYIYIHVLRLVTVPQYGYTIHLKNMACV